MIDIVALINAIPAAISIYGSIKDLLNSSKNDLEGSSNLDWCSYVNTLHGFKISWPSQRWSLAEGGNVAPNLYYPIAIRSQMTVPVNMPNFANPGQFVLWVPNVLIAIDLHGDVLMNTYLDSSINYKKMQVESIRGIFSEERSARKIEQDSAAYACKSIFINQQDSQNIILWEMTRITRSNNKMYSSHLSVVENIPNFDMIFEDILRIVETVSLLKRQQLHT